MRQKIEKVLKEQVAPILGSHGGGIELIDVKDGTAYVKFTGACVGCMSASQTVDSLVKDVLFKEVEGLEKVEVVEVIDPELLAFAKQFLKK